MSWTPYDLPHLVANLSGVNWDVLEDIQVGQVAGPAESHAPYLELTARTLDTAPLTWLDTDICQMVEETFTTVPEWSAEACMPGESGVIGLEKPFLMVMESSLPGAVEVTVDAVAWQRVGKKVALIPLSRRAGGRVFTSMPQYNRALLFDLFVLTIDLTAPQGAGSSVDIGDDELIVPRGHLDDFVSMVGAMWLLMSQPTLVEDSDEAVTRVKVRKPAPGQARRVPVRVSVRSLSAQRRVGGPGGRRGPATSRWWVRGHWRQQAWGKNRALRKPVFIAPHTAGAREAEVDDRPQVQVWRK